MTGADLIRSASSSAERAERLNVAESVRPLGSPGQTGTALDENTQNALLRFARFVTRDKKPALKKKSVAGLPAAYAAQIGWNAKERGELLDILV